MKSITTTISALCEKDKDNNFTLKWEIYPEEDAKQLEIYASDNDSIFPSTPIKIVTVNKYITQIPSFDKDNNLLYFRLKVADSFSNIISNRFYELDSIQNFRDIGGYMNVDGKQLRWNMIFRSGDFSHMTDFDKKELKKLNLKSVVDLRSKESKNARRNKIEVDRYFDLDIASNKSSASITDYVLNDKFMRGDVIIYSQDFYEDMLLKYSDEYKKLFELLLNQSNYPLVMNCTLGKDQTGVASYLLLRALDIPLDIAEEDFMLSNYGVNKTSFINKNAYHLPENQQEVLTLLTRTDLSYLRYGIARVKQEYGTFEKYMEVALGLTRENREELKKILLY